MVRYGEAEERLRLDREESRGALRQEGRGHQGRGLVRPRARRGGRRRPPRRYACPEACAGESDDGCTVDTCMESFGLVHPETSAPMSAPTPSADHSAFTQTRDCAASCADCDEIDFPAYVAENAVESHMFDGRPKCVCVKIEGGLDGVGALYFTNYDDCVHLYGDFADEPKIYMGDGADTVVLTGASVIYGVYGQGGDDVITNYESSVGGLYGEDGDDFLTTDIMETILAGGYGHDVCTFPDHYAEAGTDYCQDYAFDWELSDEDCESMRCVTVGS